MFVDIPKWSDAMVSTLVCDDSARVRRALVVALEASPTIEVMAEVADGEQVLAEVRVAMPDVIWLGSHLSGPGVVRLAAAIAEIAPGARVAMMVDPDTTQRLRALRAGAVALVDRTAAPSVAVDVTQRLAWGHCHLGRADLVALRDGYATLDLHAGSIQQRLPAPSLTAFERETLGRLAGGEEPSALAADLGVGEATLDQALVNLLGKLQRYARREAVLYAIGEQLFDVG